MFFSNKIEHFDNPFFFGTGFALTKTDPELTLEIF